MAEVREGDRAKTKAKTGDSSFPMETGAQILSAIRLRHNGKSKGPGEVLSRASRAASRLKAAGKISQSQYEAIQNRLKAAREVDAHRSSE